MGIGALLGGLASGLGQASQQKLQREFEDETNRRQQLGSMLASLATNPNAHPYTQQQSANMLLQLGQTPLHKQFKLDPEKLVTPSNLQIQPPKPPTQTATIAPTAVGGPAPASDGPQAPYQTTGLGPVPPPPAMGDLQAGQRNQAVTAPGMQAQYTPPAPPAPPPGMFMSPEQRAMVASQTAHAQSYGAMSGQIGAREEVVPTDIPSGERSGLILGNNSYIRSMNQPAVSGQGFAKDLRAEGYDVPANIPDTQYVAYKQRIGGGHDYAPTKEPGTVSGGNGTMLTSTEAAQQKSDIAQKRQQAMMGTRFGNQLALQQNAFNLALQKNSVDDANKIYYASVADYGKRLSALDLMNRNYQEALKGNQQAQVSLAMQHIGMTSGTIPGAKMSRANVDEAIESGNKVGLAVNKWFHQDEKGEWVFDGPKGGINLTKPQMTQMLDLAKERVAVQHNQVGWMQENLQPGSEFTSPGISVAGVPGASSSQAGSGKGKKPAVAAKPSSAPPAPPKEVRKPLSDFEIH